MNIININYGCSSYICEVIFSWFKKVINCIVINTNLASSHPWNGSEERGAGRGGLKEKGCREKKECIERKRGGGRRGVVRFVTLYRADSACMTKQAKSEKGATTGNVVFRLQYTLLITIIPLIKYTRVSVFSASFYAFLGIQSTVVK